MNYFDCHADTLTEIPVDENLWENSRNLDLKRVRAFAEKHIQVFALWRDRKQMNEVSPEEEFLRLHGRAMALLQEQKSRIMLCRGAEDMKQAHAEGKSAAFLSIEDCSIMGRLVERVEEFSISFALLTWNYENEYGTGAVMSQSRGLTAEGKRLVRKLTNSSVVLDISHLSDAGAEDVFSLTDAPVIASHSNVRDICHHPRNLTNPHIREIIRRGGLIGINFYEPFVASGQAGIQELLCHMDAILNMGGEHVLALGTDFDGCSNQFPQGLGGVEAIPKLREEMLRAGFGEQLVEQILFENGCRFIKQNLSYKIQ